MAASSLARADTNEVAPDMDKYRLPVALAGHGGDFHVDLGDGMWVPGQLHGRIWLSHNDMLCRMEDVQAIRLVEHRVHRAINAIVDVIRDKEFEDWGPVQTQFEISNHAEQEVGKLLECVNKRSVTGRRVLKNVRRQIIVDATTIAAPATPLSDIVVGYRALNRNRRLVHEGGTFIDAWERARARSPVGCEGIGLVFADESVAYGHPLLEQTGRFLWGEDEGQWPNSPTLQELLVNVRRIVRD